MDIRLAAIDLDDTLLRQDLTISPANRKAWREVQERGIILTLATGRSIHAMKKYARELEIEKSGGLIICGNGAEIRDMVSGASVFENRIRPDLCRRIANMLTERGFPFQFYTDDGRILASRRSRWTDEHSRLTGLPIEILPDPAPYLARGQQKFIAAGEPDSVAALYAEIAPLLTGETEILISKPYFLEIMAAGSDKGTTLEVLAGRLNIPMDSVLAVGDAQNDLGMIRKAGWGCAPSNAIPAVREAARYVSPFSHDEDAVADILRRFILVNDTLPVR